jgi:hypothetical protein
MDMTSGYGSGTFPTISALTWTNAKEVLPHEAHHFTPWLADNLELLADALGLDELVLVSKEWKVESFALDILAQGRDADGDVRVVIENQYGSTDHRHLGQILTYAAHAAAGGHRVLAVWITEEVHPAHLAAAEFLNRVAASDDATFGLVLARVRFAAAPVGWHVHFEIETEPNAFLATKSTGAPGPGSALTASARAEFIEGIVPEIDLVVAALGMARMGGINRKHGAAAYRFPPSLELAAFATARVVCARDFVNVALYIEHYPEAARNAAVADVLREHFTSHLNAYGLTVDDWHGSKEHIKRERVISVVDAGYQTGTVGEVAPAAAQVLSAWARMATDHPITGIAAAVERRLAGTA